MSGLGTDTVALTVHGKHGAVDLVVPLGASIADVSREYAAQCRLPVPPGLATSTGRWLDPAASLARSGLASGAVLAVLAPGLPVAPAPRRASKVAAEEKSGVGAALLFAVAAVMGTLGGLLVAGHDGPVHDWVVGLLVLAAVLGVLPIGRHADPRAAAAPAFAAAAAAAEVWQSGDAYQALTFGIAGLVAAVAAAVARATGAGRSEVHDVWIAGGVGVCVLAAGGVLAGADPQVGWALLLALAALAARFVPAFAVDVPDQMLIDLEKLAVTAWSARDRPSGRRGRMIVPEAGIVALLERGSRIIDAACVGILVVVVFSVPALHASTDRAMDRYGVAALVFCAGGTLLLAARAYRHPLATGMLRAAGLYAWFALASALLVDWSDGRLMTVVVAALAISGCLVSVAVATGRGWRSVWWARRAEIAEVLCGSGAVAAAFVAAGIFRHLWEFTS